MLNGWPESAALAREILLVEQEGDRITHDLSQRTNSTFVTPIDAEDIYNLAGKVDDIVDHIEEAADFMGLYGIEAPMEQAQAMADVLVKACEQLATLLENLRGFKDLDKYWIEIHRLENDGDRLFREALASLFAGGTDPMVVIRWRDIFLRLERAIDATETAAVVVRNSGCIERVSGRSSCLVKLPLRTCVMNGVGGRTLTVERNRLDVAPFTAVNVISPEPSFSFTRNLTLVVCSRPSGMTSVRREPVRFSKCSEASSASSTCASGPDPSTLFATVTPTSNSSPGAASVGTPGVMTNGPRISASRSVAPRMRR